MRLSRKTATLVALVAVSGLFSPALAQADSANNPKADIQSSNAYCGADLTAQPVIGFTNYHREGNVVSVEYHLKGAIPNSVYSVELWGDLCSFFGSVDTITTNKIGDRAALPGYAASRDRRIRRPASRAM